MKHLRRRLVTIPATIIVSVLLVLTLPLWLAIAVVVDLATRHFRLPTVRLFAFATYFGICELIAMVTALVLWLASLFGHFPLIGAHSAVEACWVRWLVRGARPTLGVRLELEEPLQLPSETIIFLSRHTSLPDAVLPAQVLLNIAKRPIHYVFKRELRRLPTLDIYGHRLANYFVARGSDTDREIAGVFALGSAAIPGSGLVIFPEGTYATQKHRTRVESSLRAAGKLEVADYAASLHVLLPPKPAGALALLEAQPTAPVCIFGHTGLDGLSEKGALRNRIPLQEPVRMKIWIEDRETIEKYPTGRVGWLQDRWSELDRWVEAETR